MVIALKNLFLLSLILIVTGCSSISRQDSLSEVTYDSLPQAAEEVSSVTTLEKGNQISIEILQDKSPKVIHEETLDHFELVTIKGVSGEKFIIKARSSCSCFGFRKWIVSPELSLFDSNNEKIDYEIFGDLAQKEIKGVFPETGEYKLIALVETKNIGDKYYPSWFPREALFTIRPTFHQDGALFLAYFDDIKTLELWGN